MAALVLFAAAARALGVAADLARSYGHLVTVFGVDGLHGAGDFCFFRRGGSAANLVRGLLCQRDVEQGVHHVVLHPLQQFLERLMAL